MLIYQVVDRAYALVQENKLLVRVLTFERRRKMTNAEKYIGDEDIIDQFIYELSNYMFEKLGWYEGDVYNLKKTIECFFKSNIKLQLTEDERVILRNIKNNDFGKYIGRGDSSRENTPVYYNLYLRGDDESKAYAIGTIYNHLFQFIKDGEEYPIEELLKGE